MNRTTTTIRTIATGLAIAATAFIAGQHGASAGEVHQAEPGEYVVIDQYRALDTRNGARVIAGNAPEIATGLEYPSGFEQAVAVAVNITVTDPSGPGYVTAWAEGHRPDTSVMTIGEAGETETSFAIVPVDNWATFRVFVSMDAHVIVDVVGYFSAGADPHT